MFFFQQFSLLETDLQTWQGEGGGGGGGEGCVAGGGGG